MGEVWIPAAQLVRGPVCNFGSGTIVMLAREYTAKSTNIGLLCRYTPEKDDKPLILIYALTSWYDGHISFGSMFQIVGTTNLFGFALQSQQFHRIEVDLSAPTAEDRGSGQIGWGDQGLRLLGHYDEGGFQGHTMEVDPATWEVVYPKPPNRNVHTRFDRWRLRLHLSEREVVTVAEASGG